MADNDVKIKVSLDGADTVQKGLNGIGDGASDANSKLGGLVSGGLKGAGTAVLGFAAAAGAAGVALTASVVKAASDYQQNIGGIETLFGDAAGKMEKYASEAYKTAGLSANDYMSQVTSFSASLLQGLGGDTAKAADVANSAMVDMSDNANKFGSNIADIQNAYQGFAKQNFTMLDNLKLGYGGTAAEMARLVNDSGVMGDSFTATAENINSVSFDKIIEAIHTVQDNMGIAGDTAKEASTTIAGSWAQLGGAYQNLLAGLGTAGSDVGQLAANVVTSFQNVVSNIVPVIQTLGSSITTLGPQLGTMMTTIVGALAAAIPAVLNTGVALVNGLITGIVSALPGLITAIVPVLVQLVTTLATLGPKLVTAGVQAIAQLANGIGKALPTLIPIIVQGVIGMVQALINAAPMLLDAALQLMTGLAQGFLSALPVLIAALPDIIQGLVDFIVGAIPSIIDAGIQLLMGLIQAIPQVIIALVEALPQIITSIITGLLTAIPLLIQAGIQLFISLITALPQIITTLIAAIPQIITSLITTLVAAIPQMIQAGIQLFISLISALPQIIIAIVKAIPQIVTGLVTAIVQAWPQLMQAGKDLLTKIISKAPEIIKFISGIVPQIINNLVSTFGGYVSNMGKVGLQLIQGLWNGISDAGAWLWGKISGFFGGIMDKIKGFFGIKSPSRLMAEEVGQWLPAGLGVGVADNTQAALQPIDDMNRQIIVEAEKLNTSASFTSDANFTQTVVPMQATQQGPAPITVEALVDPTAISSAIADSFATSRSQQDQRAVVLSKDSIKTLASAIVDSVRVQSRQGVSILG